MLFFYFFIKRNSGMHVPLHWNLWLLVLSIVALVYVDVLHENWSCVFEILFAALAWFYLIVLISVLRNCVMWEEDVEWYKWTALIVEEVILILEVILLIKFLGGVLLRQMAILASYPGIFIFFFLRSRVGFLILTNPNLQHYSRLYMIIYAEWNRIKQLHSSILASKKARKIPLCILYMYTRWSLKWLHMWQKIASFTNFILPKYAYWRLLAFDGAFPASHCRNLSKYLIASLPATRAD